MKSLIDFILNLFKRKTDDNQLLSTVNPEMFEAANTPMEKIEVVVAKEPTIIYNDAIRNKYKAGWINRSRSAESIVEVVLHGTGGGTTPEGMLSWMYDGQRSYEYNRGEALFHYLIGLKGEIIEIIDPNYYVFHSSAGVYDTKTIGIELMNSSKSNRDPYTEAQYKALDSLLFDYLFKYYKKINRISSHRYNIFVYNNPALAQQIAKQCPGAGFEWNRLDQMLKTRGYSFNIDGNLRYGVKLI